MLELMVRIVVDPETGAMLELVVGIVVELVVGIVVRTFLGGAMSYLESSYNLRILILHFFLDLRSYLCYSPSAP